MLSQGRATGVPDRRRCCACWGAGEESALVFRLWSFVFTALARLLRKC
jgi:hypothetical protein